MKKKRAVAGGLLLVLGIAQSVSAGTTTVTYHVDPSYGAGSGKHHDSI